MAKEACACARRQVRVSEEEGKGVPGKEPIWAQVGKHGDKKSSLAVADRRAEAVKTAVSGLRKSTGQGQDALEGSKAFSQHPPPGISS